MDLIHKTRCELLISEDYKYHSAIHDLSFCLSNPRIREMWKENSNFPPLFLPSLFKTNWPVSGRFWKCKTGGEIKSFGTSRGSVSSAVGRMWGSRPGWFHVVAPENVKRPQSSCYSMVLHLMGCWSWGSLMKPRVIKLNDSSCCWKEL